jgi:plasmid maintenance system antidote protein VapI
MESCTATKRSVLQLIEERGLRHGWVAARIGVSPSMLSNAVRGKRRLRSDTAQRLAELLGCAVDELDIRTHTRGLGHGG